MGLPVTAETLARPVVGMVSRMVDQKGFDLLAAIGEGLLGDGRDVRPARERRGALPGRLAGAARSGRPDRVGVHFGFDERIAHLIEAGADIFLMPSRFEPCGLNQMYSLRYGTVPVVRAIGGLDDTIDHWDSRTNAGTGFKFWDHSAGALRASLKQALDLYRVPGKWRAVQRAGMAKDFSWDASAGEYVKVYERAIRLRAGEA